MVTHPLPVHGDSGAPARPEDLPYTFEAEQGLLGAILVNNRAYELVSDYLSENQFSDPAHGRIYAECARLISRGQLANPVTLKARFDQDESLEAHGGSAYLANLAASVVTVVNAGDYGTLIRDAHLRRELLAFSQQTASDAISHNHDLTATEQIEIAENRLFTLAETGEVDRGFIHFREALDESVRTAEAAYQRDGQVAGVATGFADLDRRLGGLHRSDLVILAGRPSMGKTALATNIAFQVASNPDPDRRRQPVAFFSLEMSSQQLATRILAERTGIGSERIRRGELARADFQSLVEATGEIETAPLFIDDTPALAISALRSRARRLKRRHGLSLIVVDYLQLMTPPPGVRPDNRVQEVSIVTQNLKAVAKELDVPVLALSQLSRSVEQREDRRPMLSDLRDSGSIEQDADVVMFVFREQYYLERAEPKQRAAESDEQFDKRHENWKARLERSHGVAEIIIDKHRQGPTGIERLHFNGEITKFSDAIDDDRLPDQY